MKDRGERCDLEAGMAKLYASEAAQEAAVAAMRIAGPASQLADLGVERLYRDTPLMIIGEGTNEIQRLIIARNLLDRYGERLGALISREGEPEERRQIVLAVRQFVDKDVIPAVHDDEPAGRCPAPLLERARRARSPRLPLAPRAGRSRSRSRDLRHDPRGAGARVGTVAGARRHAT